MQIDPEFKALIPPLRPDERAALEESVAREGCRDPLVLWGDVLLDGHNRHEICERLGVAYRVVQAEGVEDRLDAEVWIFKNQVSRRNLNDDQRSGIAYKLRERLSEVAKRERAKAAGEAGGRGRPKESDSLLATFTNKLSDEPEPTDPPDDWPEPVPPPATATERATRPAAPQRPAGQRTRASAPAAQQPKPAPRPAPRNTRKEAAEALGVSEHKVRGYGEVAEKAPELAAKVDAGEITLRDAKKEIRKAEEQAKNAERAEAASAAVAGVAGVDLRLADVADLVSDVTLDGAGLVHADPPWQYDDARANGAAAKHYDVLDMPQIAALVDGSYDRAAEDCYLLLWCTWPKLGEWLTASADMRWRLVSGGCWAKTGPSGAGHHWRGDSEPLLLYVKGKPKPFNRFFSNTYVGPRAEHSEKPVPWLEGLVATFCPPGGAVMDLFAGRAPLARACTAKGYRYVGAELDADRYNAALAALGEVA